MGSVLSDIMSEPSVIEDTLQEGDKRRACLLSNLKEVEFDKIYMFGAGTSHLAGLGGRYAVERWTGITTIPRSASDFTEYGLPAATSKSLAIAISQSGETVETVVATQAAKGRGIYVVALTNNEESRVARLCDQVILLRAGHEEGPGTKTVVAQCVAIYQVALHLALAFNRDQTEAATDALAELTAAPQVVGEMLSAENEAHLQELAEVLAAEEVLYLLGAGPFWPLALQAANYLREVGKIHCCPFEATEFRHGPLEALSRSSLLILSNGQCQARDQVERASRAAADAGGRLAYMGDAEGMPDVPLASRILLPPRSELLAAQVYLAPIHLLGYLIARHKGLDPNRLDHIVKTWIE